MSDQEQTEIRKKGLAKMSEVYGWEMSDGPGDYFEHTCDQVFGTVWTREGLSNRDRRLLLFGALAASGQEDVAEIQAGAALSNGELTPHQLEEISLFLCYYVGWPLGTKMHFMFGKVIKNFEKQQAKAAE